jgi:hypothetical protein
LRALRAFRYSSGLVSGGAGYLDHYQADQRLTREAEMGLIELLLIVLVVAAIAGGLGLSPLLWLLLIVAAILFFTGGGFGYRRGGRI